MRTAAGTDGKKEEKSRKKNPRKRPVAAAAGEPPPPPPLAPQEKIIKPNPIQYDQHGGIGYPERPTKLTVEAIKDLKWNREND